MSINDARKQSLYFPGDAGRDRAASAAVGSLALLGGAAVAAWDSHQACRGMCLVSASRLAL